MGTNKNNKKNNSDTKLHVLHMQFNMTCFLYRKAHLRELSPRICLPSLLEGICRPSSHAQQASPVRPHTTRSQRAAACPVSALQLPPALLPSGSIATPANAGTSLAETCGNFHTHKWTHCHSATARSTPHCSEGGCVSSTAAHQYPRCHVFIKCHFI